MEKGQRNSLSLFYMAGARCIIVFYTASLSSATFFSYLCRDTSLSYCLGPCP